jgi:hypothetical protein
MHKSTYLKPVRTNTPKTASALTQSFEELELDYEEKAIDPLTNCEVAKTAVSLMQSKRASFALTVY